MQNPKFNLKGDVWLYNGDKASWHFVFIGKDVSKKIKNGYMFIGKRGFGSVPVSVSLGKTKWKTSVFPDRKIGGYILPLKKEVRKKENIKSGDVISFSIEVLI